MRQTIQCPITPPQLCPLLSHLNVVFDLPPGDIIIKVIMDIVASIILDPQARSHEAIHKFGGMVQSCYEGWDHSFGDESIGEILAAVADPLDV